MTDERYELREYRPGDEHSILRGFNRVFRDVCGPGYVDRGLDFWRWEFEQNPAGNRISLGLHDGEVAAQYAGVPQRFWTAFGPMTFVHIVDSFVVPEHRAGLKRPGLFVTAALPWFELCHRLGDAVLYGYPVKTAERIGQRYLEYKFLRVIDYLCRDAAAGSVAIPAGVEVARVHTVPADVDELFATFAPQRACLLQRDRIYLDWRYVQVPGGVNDYEIHVARRDGRICGLMVLRPVHELVPDACTIADWIVPDGDDAVVDALLARATDVARTRGRKVVMAVFADPCVEARTFAARGFDRVPSTNYLERRLTHRIYDARLSTEWLEQHWWYTLGDTDLV